MIATIVSYKVKLTNPCECGSDYATITIGMDPDTNKAKIVMACVDFYCGYRLIQCESEGYYSVV